MTNCIFSLICLLLFSTTIICQEESTSETTESSTSVVTEENDTSTYSSTTVTESSTNTDFTSTSTAVPPIPSKILTDKSFTWSSSDDISDSAIVVEAEEGYFISVKVSGVDMSDGNYLLIQGGNSDNPKSEDRRIFTNTVKGPDNFLFLTSTVYAFVEKTKPDSDNAKAEFTVVFERFGEITTTSSTTSTTTIITPTTEKDDVTEITVYLDGRYLSDFQNSEVTRTFQDCVAQIAQNYCNQQNIPLIQQITREYVIIDGIFRCPYNWPHSSKCVQITFKLPIFYNTTNKWSGYQLNSENLEIMWLRKDEFNSSCLYSNQFYNYDEPDFERSITWWAVGISLVLVAFIALLWFLRTFSSKLKIVIKKRQRKNSDTVSIMSRKTNSISSLAPHYLQDHLEVPKLFES